MLKEIVGMIGLFLGVGSFVVAVSVIFILVFSEELDRIIGEVDF